MEEQLASGNDLVLIQVGPGLPRPGQVHSLSPLLVQLVHHSPSEVPEPVASAGFLSRRTLASTVGNPKPQPTSVRRASMWVLTHGGCCMNLKQVCRISATSAAASTVLEGSRPTCLSFLPEGVCIRNRHAQGCVWHSARKDLSRSSRISSGRRVTLTVKIIPK